MGIGNEFVGDVEKLLVNDVIKSKNLFRFSKENYLSYTFIFEKQIKEMFNASGVLMFPSATIALTTFLKTLKLGEKDEVIIPPFSWVADYSAFLFENIKLRFCEINPKLQITSDSIKEMVNENTKIVLIPHLMGRGQQEIVEIVKLCKEKNIVLIEDIAQSFGVKIGGKYAGSFGNFSFSSLNHHKILSTGDGGFAIIKDYNTYNKMCQIHDQGCLIDKKGKRNVMQEKYNKGLSLRVNNLTGAVALAQLSRFLFIKSSILEKYNVFKKLLNEKEKKYLINTNNGDIPYTALFKSKANKSYPSLLKSGWHYVENIPYFRGIEIRKKDKENIKKSKKYIESTYAIGTGFIDKYYAISKGININEEIKVKNIKEIIKEIL